jgi:hypothetical protein
MKKLLTLLVAFGACLGAHADPFAQGGNAPQLKVVHWCKGVDGRLKQRVDGCPPGETEVRDVSAQDPNAQAAFERVTKAYATESDPVGRSVREADDRRARHNDEVMHWAHLRMLRTFGFILLGGFAFKLLLRRSFLIGGAVGFVVEAVLVGAAVLN